jgi:hypothetical protein
MRLSSPRRSLLLLAAGLLTLAGCDARSTGIAADRVPANMEIVSGNNQSAPPGGELAQPLVVRVTDGQGQPVQGQAVVFRVTSGGGTVFAGVSVTNAQGIAKERWTLGTSAGTAQKVEARGVDNNTGQGHIFAVFSATVTSGTPHSVIVESGNNQTGVINAWMPQPLVAKVLDAAGNPVAGVSVTFSANVPGRFDPADSISVTGTAGRAPVRWMPYQATNAAVILATVQGVGSPARFNAIVKWGVADVNLLPERDTLQVGEMLQMQATALNGSGQPISGIKFSWGSNKAFVATVDSTGKVTATGPGETFVIATAEGHADTSFITVTQAAFASVDVGPELACAVDVTGRAVCFDGSIVHVRGTGYTRMVATRTPDDAPQGCGITVTGQSLCNGTAIPGGVSFARLTFGGPLCGLDAAGKAYCRGSNTVGQLGIGTIDNTYRTTPVAVSGNASYASISGGGSHACALNSAGAAYCWGYDAEGQLGTAATTETCAGQPCSSTPRAVQGAPAFAAITTGEYHTCALDGDGVAYCWGSNEYGQVGAETTATCTSHASTVACAPLPVAVNAGALRFVRIAAGAHHTCALTAAGAAWCWGVNNESELGTGSDSPAFSRTPLAVAGGIAFKEISAGRGDSFFTGRTCAISTAGALYCWGERTSTSPSRINL